MRVTGAAGRELREPAHLRLRLEEGQTLRATTRSDRSTEGAVLRLPSVSVEPLPEPKPGAFDYGRYLRRRGEHVLLEADFSDLTDHRPSRRPAGRSSTGCAWRLASHLAAGVHSPVAEVLQGMVLGDDEGVDPALVEDFRRSGLLHIMAVSGENVVLLCTMWSFAFALLGIHRLVRTALLLPVVATYVLLTGASPSIVRAGVAGIVGLLAILASRPSDGWLLWLAPAAWLLTVNPNNLFDVSFQLSFGAVVGLLVLARPLTRAVSFLPGPLPEQVGVTTAASISTAPVSMLTFGSASLVSVPANVAGGFVLGPIMFLGMLSLLLGFVSRVAVGAAQLRRRAVHRLPARRVALLRRPAGGGVRVPGRDAAAGAASWACWPELAVVAVLAARAGGGLLAYVRDRRRWPPFAAATAALLAAALLLAPAPVRPPDRPTLTFLDVGEGAATCCRCPAVRRCSSTPGPSRSRAALRRARRAPHRPAGALPRACRPRGRARGRDRARADRRRPAAGPAGPLGRRLTTCAGGSSAGSAEGPTCAACTAAQAWRGCGWALRVLPTRAAGGEDGNQSENDCALVALVGAGRPRRAGPRRRRG